MGYLDILGCCVRIECPLETPNEHLLADGHPPP